MAVQLYALSVLTIYLECRLFQNLLYSGEISVKTKSSVTGVKWKLKSGLMLSSPKYVSNDGILSGSSQEEDN